MEQVDQKCPWELFPSIPVFYYFVNLSGIQFRSVTADNNILSLFSSSLDEMFENNKSGPAKYFQAKDNEMQKCKKVATTGHKNLFFSRERNVRNNQRQHF